MWDYEHMMIALDEYICHHIAGVICMENYFDCSFPKAFRNVFDSFCEFREDYEQNKKKYMDKDKEKTEKIRFQLSCRKKKEELFRSFIENLEKIDSEINYKQSAKDYFETLKNEDVQTPEMYLAVYPMLISLIREKEERCEL